MTALIFFGVLIGLVLIAGILEFLTTKRRSFYLGCIIAIVLILFLAVQSMA